ncbi:MAG: cation:proton antiporter, partial [Candidatus Dormibacteraeota bacterium]|nr:cation:proton antiporter [Candidatus Dormibacteraeota bacterium]
VAIFRRLGVPHRLRNLVEGESLLNDGTGVVLFTIALTATQGGFSIPSAALDFIRLTVGGLALGGALGLVLSRITGFVDDPQVEITLTAVAAYGGYLAGETLHVSGILTVVAAGLVIGNYARQRRMSERTRQAVETMWDYVAFALNAAVFVLIAGVVPVQVVIDHAAAVLAGAAALLAARAMTVYGLVNLLRPLRRPLGLRSQHLLAWGGLRGAVAIALLLSLPPEILGFDTLRAVIYGAVLSSILVQGVLLVPLTRLLLPPLARNGENRLT